MLLMDQIQPLWWYVIWVYVIQDFTVYRCISTPPPFQMDLRMKCPFVILLTKNLKHQNTPWNTLSPSPRLHKLLHGIGDTVIFLSLKPAFRHGRRILFDNTSRHHSQQGAENEVKKRTPQAILQEIYQIARLVEKTSNKKVRFLKGGN